MELPPLHLILDFEGFGDAADVCKLFNLAVTHCLSGAVDIYV